MKIKLLLIILISSLGFAQPQIAGDTMLCPFSNGTAYVVNDQNFDTYTWYWKYWFSSDEFEAVPGVSGPTFIYDWYTYDQALIKVVVTLNGETFESNTIQIDSYAWVGLTTGFQDSENISIDQNNGNVLLCAGTTFNVEVYNPYTIVQWYRDGVEIPGANTMSYEISGPGVYHVVAAPDFCPNNAASSEGTPIIVQIDNDCTLGIDGPDQAEIFLYPNPVVGKLHVSKPVEFLRIHDLSGKTVYELSSSENTAVDMTSMPAGTYFVEMRSEGNTVLRKIVKR